MQFKKVAVPYITYPNVCTSYHVKQGTMRLAYSPRFFFSTNYEWVYEPNPSPDRKYQNLEVNLVPISYILVSTQN